MGNVAKRSRRETRRTAQGADLASHTVCMESYVTPQSTKSGGFHGPVQVDGGGGGRAGGDGREGGQPGQARGRGDAEGGAGRARAARGRRGPAVPGAPRRP